MILTQRDCNIFGGTMFGCRGSGGTSDIPNINDYHILILTGNAFTTELGIMIDGGTATSKDTLSFNGGSSFD